MKVGLSTYSMYGLIESGEMSVPDVIGWIAENGGECAEIVPFGFDLTDNDALTDAIVAKAKAAGLTLSCYSISANLLAEDRDAYEAEVRRVMRHVDIAHRLGVPVMRHDVSSFDRPPETNDILHFDREFPQMVDACGRIADYAAKRYGISTTVENHGYFVNGSDRVLRLYHAVDRPNFRGTLDIGNLMCVDENPLTGIKKLLPFAAQVHFKDFYLRHPSVRDPGPGYWIPTAGGDSLRGAIVGHGDVDVWQAMKLIKESGYDGSISVEFEGMEDPKTGSSIGLANVRRIWNEV